MPPTVAHRARPPLGRRNRDGGWRPLMPGPRLGEERPERRLRGRGRAAGRATRSENLRDLGDFVISGGLNAEAVPSEPLPFAEILRSRVWYRLALGQIYDLQSTIFQPVGGMDMIARAFVRQIGGLIRYNAKVTAIKQDDNHVTNRANVRLLAQAMSDHSSSVSGLPRSCKSAA